jgi:curved DNA-binding protein CbpA
MNYYLILGVSQEADVETIRSAFRALARRYHPDAGVGSSAEKFRAVVEAYETLSDPDLRRRYDERLNTFRPLPSSSRWSRPVPEPLIPERRPFASKRSSADFSGTWEDLVEELFRSFDEMFQ